MWEQIRPWLGDVHSLLAPEVVGPVVSLAAILCGGMTGFERQRAAKPAGFRTMILICLGSAVFTQASILLGGGPAHADRARVAAQVVTGIGFLGAGAILRERGQVVGITTAASIWATAAVGLILGAGHLALGFFFTLLIVGTLSAARAIERLVEGPCRLATLALKLVDTSARTRLQVESILEDHPFPIIPEYTTTADGAIVARIRYCTLHRDHHTWLNELIASPAIESIEHAD